MGLLSLESTGIFLYLEYEKIQLYDVTIYP